MTESAIRPFTLAERDRRWGRAREFLADRGLDALLVFGEHEDAGPAPVAYDTWFTNARPGTTVVFSATGEAIVLLPGSMFIMDHVEASRRGEQMWIAPEQLRGARNSATIVAALRQLGLDRASVGVVGLGPHMPWNPQGIIPYGIWSAVLADLPETDFRPVDTDFGAFIMPLGDEEIAQVKHAAAIGDAMAEAMVMAAAPGVLESTVYAAGMAAGFARGTLPAAMHLWSGPDVVAAAPPAWGSRPHAPRVLAEGDVIYGEVFSHVGGRHAQSQVMIAVGDVHDDFHRAADVARASYEEGLRALVPGRSFGDLVDAMQAPIDAASGWPFLIHVHSLNPPLSVGKGRGIFSRRPEVEGYPAVPDHPTFLPDLVVRPGMTFAFEPNYAFGRHLAHLGGTVLVGEDGAVELNPYTARMLQARGGA